VALVGFVQKEFAMKIKTKVRAGDPPTSSDSGGPGSGQ
jgi:hypothetical protein